MGQSLKYHFLEREVLQGAIGSFYVKKDYLYKLAKQFFDKILYFLQIRRLRTASRKSNRFFIFYISLQILSSTSIFALLSPDCHFKLIKRVEKVQH